MNTTLAGQWQTLVFDFSNQAPGTAAINFANTYNKMSIFFNFGTSGATAGEKTYYWDDMQFGGAVGVNNLDAAAAGIRVYPNPATAFCMVELPEALNAPAQLLVLDATGRLVRSLQTSQQATRLELDGLENGLYTLQIRQASATYFQKLVVLR